MVNLLLFYVYNIYIWLSAHYSMCINYLNDRDSIIYMSIHKVEEVEFEYKLFLSYTKII